MSGLLVAVIAVPALASLVGLLSARAPVVAKGLALVAAPITLVIALTTWVAALASTGPTPTARLLPAPHTGSLEVTMRLGGGLWQSGVAVAVALVATCVQVYAVWYLARDDRAGRFVTTVSLFTAAMLLVVHSRDLVLTLIGWEVMGWCSYLLIGHWSRREAPRRAAHKAFLVTRLADVGFVLGVVGLAAGAGSTSIDRVVEHWASVEADGTLRAVALSLLVVGVLGKSAQVPFQDWLADAMEGPTPASALIHAATMVAAGTVVLAHLFPVLAVTGPARWLLAVATGVTMLLAGILALGQSDLKRLLAWSTVSQVAVMLSVLAAPSAVVGFTAQGPAADGLVRSLASPDPGVFHLWSHAIFKALLFLTIGWLGALAGGTSARALHGSARRHVVARYGFLAGLLSLAGVPLTVGGFSKEHVVTAAADAFPVGPAAVVLVAVLLTVVLTAAYCTRAYLIVTARPQTGPALTSAAGMPPAPAPPPGGDGDVGLAPPAPAAHPPTADAHPPTVTLPVQAVIATLAGLTLLGGLVLLTHTFGLHGFSLLWTLGTLVLVMLGVILALGAAFATGHEADPAVSLGERAHWWDSGFGADTAYVTLVAKPVLALARAVEVADRRVIDAHVAGLALATRVAGDRGEQAHDAERPSTGLRLVVGGVVALAALLGVVAWR